MVTALGELLIDFTPADSADVPLFETHPGGAPGNMLVMMSKLGHKCSFIGMVGNDRFGDLIIHALNHYGVETGYIQKSNKYNTTMAFVHLNEDGDRSFTFCRKHGADIFLTLDTKSEDVIKKSKIFHFGSLSLTDEPVRSTTLKALELAKNNGIFISYDPNLRIHLWDTLQEAQKQVCSVVKYVDLIKMSEDELELITGITDPDGGSLFLQKKYNTPVILITMGTKGSFYRIGKYSGHVDTTPVKAIDTTASGDAFTGAFVHKLLEVGLENIGSIDNWNDKIYFANVAGALTATKKGAMDALPDMDSILKYTK